ncbi:GNAT family N-acetyltransferase [Bowmanella denitrificans]|uniref:GNAT family N-acetyltransferase n=1 Tax=Bowmanella denitrificans TaxID=366582 RepID=UPI001FE8EA6D|nr:GNAT family N-acetyltransferase [Bowmanella denitrificans]
MYSFEVASKKHNSSVQRLLLQLGYSSVEEDIIKFLELQNSNSEVLVIIFDSQVVGLISLVYYDYFPLQRKICRITSVVIEESFRGKGIGRKVMDLACERARDNDCHKLEVTTSLARKKTHKFYESFGFKKSSFRYAIDL